MFGKIRISLVLLLLLPLFWPIGSLVAQERASSSEAAVSAFDEGHYRAALERFRILPETETDKGMRAYYRGRCLLELNQDLDEAIELLYAAAQHQETPSDVYLYLGLAYQRSYVFDEAIKSFSRYEEAVSRQEGKNSGVKQLIANCRSALHICSSYNQYEVMTVAFLDMSDSASFSQIRMKGGKLQRKYSIYFDQGEDREGLNSLMFVPSRPIRGDYMFYAGGRADGKEGYQLYRIRRGSGRWGEPEALKELNTPGNELLPYFDPIENDLYFASDGRSGVGGYDLYRSHYDSDRDSWTEAINLGFPVNSAMDEFLLLPGTDLGMLMFFTNRQGTDSTLTVYRVHLAEPKKEADTGDSELLQEIASLGGVALDILAELERKKTGGPGVYGPEKGSESEVSESEVSESPVSTEPSSQEILAEALLYQAASDSLKDLAMLARRRIRESDDPNDRWVWQNQIMVWERRAQEEESRADTLYALLEMDGPETRMDESVVPARIEGEPGTPPPDLQEEAKEGYIRRFDILQASPYGASHPIPLDVDLPEGVFYRIQLAAFGSNTDPGTFKGLSPLTAESIPDRDLVRYYAGKFSRYQDAALALEKVRSLAYEDAFIVAWYDGNSLAIQRAKQLE